MKTKSQFLLFLLSLFFSGGLTAQQNTVATGSEASGSGGTVSYTVGQIDYTSQSGSSGTIHQGVQQPLEFFNLSVKENQLDFSVNIYPNPVIAELQIDLSEASLDKLTYSLTDATGKLIQSETISTDKLTINMVELSRANYFLNFTKEGQIVSSYKIIKN
jgi:hypothetical protein